MLASWKETYNKLSIFKSKTITLLTKVHIVKALVFPVIMYRCERWIVKKAEHQRIDAFKLWHWRGLLRIPWITSRSNWWILKEISPEYSLEGLMLKLKLQYFGHLIQRAGSLEKTLMRGKIEGKTRRGQQRMRWLDGITDSVDINLSRQILEDNEVQGNLVCCSPWGCRVRQDLASEWLNTISGLISTLLGTLQR